MNHQERAAGEMDRPCVQLAEEIPTPGNAKHGLNDVRVTFLGTEVGGHKFTFPD